MTSTAATLVQQIYNHLKRNEHDLNTTLHGELMVTFAHGAVTKVELLKRANVSADPNATLSAAMPTKPTSTT